MSTLWPPHDPNALSTYTADWTRALNGTTIADSTFVEEEVDDELSGITLSAPGFSTTKATVRITGGMVGKMAVITNHIVFANGDTDDETFLLPIQNA